MTKLKKVKEITTQEELSKEMEKTLKRGRSLELQIKRTAKKLCLEHPDAIVENIGVWGYTFKASELYAKRGTDYNYHTCLSIIKQIEKQIKS